MSFEQSDDAGVEIVAVSSVLVGATADAAGAAAAMEAVSSNTVIPSRVKRAFMQNLLEWVERTGLWWSAYSNFRVSPLFNM
jgi:hypothetical protein